MVTTTATTATTTATTTASPNETTATAAEAAVPASVVPHGPVEATISFIQPHPNANPIYNYVSTPPPGQPVRNFDEIPHNIHLTDIRDQPGGKNSYTLDTHAFQIISDTHSATTYETYESDEAIRREYYPEIEALLLKHIPSVHKVVIFDHTIRRQGSSETRQPATLAHIDQTTAAAVLRVRLHVKDKNEAEELLKGRFRVVNIWRPINGRVISAPLTVAEPESVVGSGPGSGPGSGLAGENTGDGESELLNVELRYPDRTGEITGVRYGRGQRWLYLSGMEGSEWLLLKCADSAEGLPRGHGSSHGHGDGHKLGQGDGDAKIAGRVPHASFLDPRAGVGNVPWKPRESIEVRTLVFG